MEISMIKAILFDMDGVLIDAKEWHYQALNRALELFGYTIEREAHLTTYDGLPTSRKLAILAQTHGLPKKLMPFINRLKQNYTLEKIYSSCRPLFIHRYALGHLHREGYRLAVCSNAVRQSVHAMMQQAALDEYLCLQLSNEDVVNPKPDPEIYLTAMKRLELSPQECLIVEDNENGIRAAKASGAHVMCVSEVSDVTYEHIKQAIRKAETGKEAIAA
jgi:beta-phosphoglucomutase-like phosphatase (HAD superfamily)